MTDFSRRRVRGYLNSLVREAPGLEVHGVQGEERLENLMDAFQHRYSPQQLRASADDDNDPLGYIEIAIREAFENARDPNVGLLAALRGGSPDDPTGALQYRNNGAGTGYNPHVYVDWLGSNQRGAGTALLKALRDIDRRDIRLYAATDDAQGFYESLGFQRPYANLGRRHMLMPANEPWHRAQGGYIK